MSLEHVNFTIVAIILLIPIVCCVIPMTIQGIRYWREKRREKNELLQQLSDAIGDRILFLDVESEEEQNPMNKYFDFTREGKSEEE